MGDINIFDLTDQIANAVNEDTTSSSMSYLPDGFTTMKQAIRALASNKPKWNIDILEDAEQYKVDFEDALHVIIPKQHYDDFNTKVLNIKGLKEIDLTPVLNEATQEDVTTVTEELTKELTVGLRDVFVVENSIYLFNSWQRVFGGNAVQTTKKPMLSIGMYDRDIRSLVQRIKTQYNDDAGSMELVVEAIKNRTPLNNLDFFSSFEFLLGGRIESVYKGVNLTFDIAVNLAWQPVQSIWCDNPEVLDEMDYYRKYVKQSGKTIVPVNGYFTVGVYNALKDVIDEVV